MQNGRVYVQKAYEIPEGSRTSRAGIPLILEMQRMKRLLQLSHRRFDLNFPCTVQKGVVKQELVHTKTTEKGVLVLM